MARSPFGWDYPAGAEHDPNAPWNQPDLPDECPTCRKPNYDDDGEPLHDGVFCSQTCEDNWEEPIPPED
jgi:hypothetical protein